MLAGAPVKPQAEFSVNRCIWTFVVLLLYCVPSISEENASNPLAAVSNTDVRAKYIDLDQGDRMDYYIDGATMLTPKTKLKYELHYWDTDVTGRDEHDWESVSFKLIHFAKEGKLSGDRPYRLAIGIEWIKDLGDIEKGIGRDADLFAPLVGLAMVARPGTSLIPLVQHFESYSGEDVSETAFRLIAIQALPDKVWAKADLKVPYDWENDAVPASLEMQLGKSFTPSFGAYVDVQTGIGGDKPYDWAAGVGLRFSY